MPRVIATIQSRMGSQRLPGKTLRPMAGRPLLARLLDRVKQVRGLDGIVVATPESAENDMIAELCKKEDVACFRGPEDDVLGRMLGALTQEQADIGVEVYGDSPVIDPALVEECLVTFQEGGYDLVGNDMIATYPSGMYNEAFSVQALRDSASRTTDPAVREHGTLFLRTHPELYRTLNIEAKGDLRRPDIHLDCDTDFDFALLEAIYAHFAPRIDFTLPEILGYLDANPELAKSNQHVQRRWKQYQRSGA
jgi:spore coat polysaccharide biosynthesis protein SpsF